MDTLGHQGPGILRVQKGKYRWKDPILNKASGQNTASPGKIISYRMVLKGMMNIKYINLTHGYVKH